MGYMDDVIKGLGYLLMLSMHWKFDLPAKHWKFFKKRTARWKNQRAVYQNYATHGTTISFLHEVSKKNCMN